MNTFKIAVALNLDYSSVRLIMDKVGHDMCLKAQCAFRVAPNSCTQNALSKWRHTCAKQWDHHRNPSASSIENRLPSTDWQLQFNDLFRTKSLSMLTWSSMLVNLRLPQISGDLPSRSICLLRGLPSSGNSQRLGHCWDMVITCGWNVIHDRCNAVNASCMWANSRARGCNTESFRDS